MGLKSRLTKKTKARVSVFLTTFVAVLGMTASPALASTSVGASVYGSPCGTNSMFANFSGTATTTAGGAEVDFTNLVYGTTIHLSGCGATTLCIDMLTYATVAAGAIGVDWTGMYLDLASGSETHGGVTAVARGTTCNPEYGASVAGWHINGDPANDFVWSGSQFKLKSYQLMARARVLIGSTWYYTGYASQTVNL